MRGRTVAASLCAGAAAMAYAVRGRGSNVFGPSVYRGQRLRRSIALTFDDGPSESTEQILAVLDRHRVPATFFQCGANVRRLPAAALAVTATGHEIGNHSDSHARLWLRPERFILDEFTRAQETFGRVLALRPNLMRAPYGVRWFGFRAMQEHLGLLGVMWSVIGLDWELPAAAIFRRVVSRCRNGTIICLHDGRELARRPDISQTIEAVRQIVPALQSRGYQFETVSQILCSTT